MHGGLYYWTVCVACTVMKAACRDFWLQSMLCVIVHMRNGTPDNRNKVKTMRVMNAYELTLTRAGAEHSWRCLCGVPTLWTPKSSNITGPYISKFSDLSWFTSSLESTCLLLLVY